MKKSLRRITAVAAALAALVAVVGAVPAESLGKGGDGKFHVYGTNVVGPDGKGVVLRGVAKNGLEYSAKGYQDQLWNYERMHDWGANVVRLALATTYALPVMCTYDRKYMQIVDRVVSYAERLKMVVLLDNHFSTAGRTCGTGGWSTNQKMPDRYSLDFVKMLAKRYKNRPYVAIDLHNEPHDISWDIWRNGGIVDGYRAVGMQQMLDAVRSQGFKGLVVATGAAWGNDVRELADAPLDRDTNVIYGAHVYPYWCHARIVYKEEPYRCDGRQRNPTYDSWVQPLVGRRALMITEFSTQRPIDGEMREPIQWAEDRNLGWIAWDWCYGAVDHYCLLSQNGNGQPSAIGKPVLDFLLRANGWRSPGGR